MIGEAELAEAERFWPKVDLLGGCWLWLAATNDSGYGTFMARSRTDDTPKTVRAHRWSYEHLVGPVPEGLELDHLCRTPACVRPEHLEPVTRRENTARGNEARGTTAQHGTTSMYHNNGCRCRPCTDASVAYKRGYRARKRAEAAA